MIALHFIEIQEARIQEQQKSKNYERSPLGKKQNTPPIQNNHSGNNKEILAMEIKVASVEVNMEQKDESFPAKKDKGKLLMDATVAPQNITFPTDLKLLNAACKKSE